MRRGQICKWNKELERCEWFDIEPPPENVSAYVQDDTIPPTESMATANREIFESKSALMRHYAEHGYECTGGAHNDGAIPFVEYRHKSDINQIRATVQESIRQNIWGMAPLTERERHRRLTGRDD